MASSCAATIRGASETDTPRLEAFFREVWAPPPFLKNEQWLRWLLVENPNRRGGASTLLLAEVDDRIVGIVFLTPTYLHHGDRSFHVAWGRDLFVHPDHRRQGIALALNRRWIEEYDVRLGSGQSPENSSLQRSHGIAQVAEIHQYERVYARAGHLLASVREGPRRAVRRALAMAYGLLPRGPLARGDVTVRTAEAFDPRVEDLWQACRSTYPGICARDFRTLSWRFTRHPYHRFTVFEAVDARGVYRGYLVARMADGIGRIVDFLVGRDDPGVLRALLRAADRHFRREGAVRSIARFLGPMDAVFAKERFIRTRFQNRLAVKTKDDAIASLLVDWYVTMLDSDLDR